MRRLARLTNAFSKKAENHLHALQFRSHLSDPSLHPSDAAGVTTKPCALAGMAKVLEDWKAHTE
jgi:hypothetical protein